jgi:hypothetical protein
MKTNRNPAGSFSAARSELAASGESDAAAALEINLRRVIELSRVC